MRMHTKDFEKLLDDESDEFEQMFDQEKVNAKINKLVAKERHSDFAVYKGPDSKRKMKNR